MLVSVACRPNILIVIADQLSPHALDCYGHDFARTPHLDRIAANGIRFDRAYTNCPLCLPSRASFWTGRYPHQTGVLSNGRFFDNAEVTHATPSVGSLLSGAGWRCRHFGKCHDGGALHGFDCAPMEQVRVEGPQGYAYNPDTFHDEDTCRKVERFLATYDAEEPFCCVADLINPHNICGFVAENREGCIDDDLPSLPGNFAFPDLEDRPAPVRYVCCAHRRQMQASDWSVRQYRQYRAAYRHFTEVFDAHLGRILAALDDRGDADDTLILFWSDHGDAMGAHRLVTKHTTFYEETTRVPLLACGPGVTARGVAFGDPLVSLVDILPTLCDVADRGEPEGLPGASFADCFRGEAMPNAHDQVISQWHTEWGTTVEPGRMLRGQRHKYTVYREDDGEELFDLHADPGELRNLVDDDEFAEILDEYRERFADYCREWDDDFADLDWKADPRWREHRPGYDRHRGTCAPVAQDAAN